MKHEQKNKTMEAKDLMIGDWVRIKDGNPFKMEDVSGTSMFRRWTSDGEIMIPYGWNEIEPIPLTAEILEKNGFVKELDKDNTHYRFGLTEGCTFFSVKYARSVFQWLGPLDFKYVHELQHALRLCGIEKEIVL